MGRRYSPGSRATFWLPDPLLLSADHRRPPGPWGQGLGVALATYMPAFGNPRWEPSPTPRELIKAVCLRPRGVTGKEQGAQEDLPVCLHIFQPWFSWSEFHFASGEVDFQWL